jgi:glutamate-ammonia-ligase adenylyltransferase
MWISCGAWLLATRPATRWCRCAASRSINCPGRAGNSNAVAVAAGWPNDDGSEFLDNYLRVTRRAKSVVRKVSGD